jgi:inner membrane transporter RhtA
MHFAHASDQSMIRVVSTSAGTAPATVGAPGSTVPNPAPGRNDDWPAGITLMTGAATSVQIGAAIAAQSFPVLGPAGVVAIRQWVASTVLLVTVRPRVRAFTRRQWQPVIALAVVYAVMNITLYVAIQRLGLGLGVTLEFLGPLSVALSGALLASRRAVDLGCALVAGAAVVVLGRPGPTTDYAGIAIGLLSAAAWAGYIVVNRAIAVRFTVPAQGTAVAGSLSALLYLPVGIWVLATHEVTAVAIARAMTAGILCSVVPMLTDPQALRRVPARFYSVFMSINPVLAAIIGLVILGQHLGLTDWLAIAAIVSANTVAIATRPKGQE